MNKSDGSKQFLFLAAIALCVIALFSFIFHLPAHAVLEQFIYNDAKTYIRAAHSIYREHLFPDPIRPFGYPLLLGIPYFFGEVSRDTIVYFGVFLNILFFLGSVFLLNDLLSGMLKSTRAAFILTLLFIFSFSNVTMLYQLMTETFFIFIILFFLNHLLKFITTNAYKHMWLSLGALCYSVVVRPIGFYFALLALLLSAIYVLKNKNAAKAIFIVGIYFATIGIQSINMYRTYGSYTVSYIQNYTLHYYIVTKAQYLKDGRPMLFGAYSQQYKNASDSIIASQASPDDPVAYWKVAEPHHKKAVKDFMQGGGKFLLKAFGFNILENTRSDNQVFHFYEESERKWKSINIVQKITYYQNILFTLALIGSSAFIAISFFAAQNYKRPLFWFITVTTAIAMYFLLVSGISHWQGDRFNYVCYPLTIILVSFIVFYQRNKKRDQYPNQA